MLTKSRVENMYEYYYLLGGASEELAFSELEALLETYDRDATVVEKCARVCVVKHSRNVVQKIVERAGYIRESGHIIGYDDLINPTYSYIDKISGEYTWIKPLNPYSLRDEKLIEQYLQGLMRLTGVTGEYRRGPYLRAIFTERNVIIGAPRYVKDTKSFEQRKPSKRPFFRSISLPPEISRVLINLARVKEGEVLLDPFAGTGSVLIEAGFMGIRGIGVDIDRELVYGMIKNLEFFNLRDQIVILGDSREILYMNVDGVATDPPYGRAASTHGSSIQSIYRGFLEKMTHSVKSGGYIVFMAPLSIEDYVDSLVCELGLLVRRKHYIYVHGSLTRVIYEVVNP